jgi:hypothetical protein
MKVHETTEALDGQDIGMALNGLSVRRSLEVRAMLSARTGKVQGSKARPNACNSNRILRAIEVSEVRALFSARTSRRDRTRRCLRSRSATLCRVRIE